MISKVTGVRDFFVTLFFVALGMKVPIPTGEVVGQALLIVVFVFVSRFVAVMPAVALLGDGLYAGTVTSLNLAQISEFSLVILTLGAGYGHIALEMPDVAKACADVKARGGSVTREAGPVKGGTTVIAFVQDPDGYKIEFIERKPS